MRNKYWMQFSGMIWLVGGCFLLYKGFSLTENFILYAVAVPLGCLKGHYVLSKTVHRVMKRITSSSEVITLRNLYPLSYWMLIASMIGFGVLCRFLPNQVRGLIDLTIGSALVYGAFIYFRSSLEREIEEV